MPTTADMALVCCFYRVRAFLPCLLKETTGPRLSAWNPPLERLPFGFAFGTSAGGLWQSLAVPRGSD